MVQSVDNFGKNDEQFQKWICLDLDGTLVLKNTNEGSLKGECHPKTIQTLRHAHRIHWNIAIITGRTLSFAKRALSSIDFPYTLAVQQGSHLFSMPNETLLTQHILEPEAVQEILRILIEEEVPAIAYLGYENGDACIYSKEHVDQELLSFFKTIEKISLKPWIEVPSLSQVNGYPSSLIKGFSYNPSKLKKVEEKIQKKFDVAITLIKDPLSSEGQFYLLITAKGATKGEIVRELVSSRNATPIIIGAGDDENDLSMLSLCTYRLVMDDAPTSLKKIATTIVSSKDPLDLSAKIEMILS
jgi:HAD superfamily hydrolase (TIGR01484 family)